MLYAKLAKLLTDQGIDVVFATISMFHKVREWNKSNIKKYIEIYKDAELIEKIDH